ncbi:exonuclease SbcCD subunit D [Coprococcus sp. AF99-45]|jgi:exonuclease SbcD|uniref:exonuclease SbcCD subunit D n=1 Tax=Coprococcus sp. AF99-45 TaxID=2997948 RepID=UPI0022E94C76|nr:exonuclease SbcCD subunit D [Coprococcus sp. AF99-45]
MRFLHLSDLHLGKRVNEFSMLEDQAYILKEILNIIDEQKVEAVLIAGDIYDKVIPSAEAVRLLDDFLTRIAARELPVFLISGNHDSAERVAFGSRLMSSRQIYLSPVFESDVEPITISDRYGEIHIYMLPFVKPSLVKRVYPEEEIITYQDAVNAAVQHMQIDTDKRNILLAHQFVTGAARCDSEELSVGGLDDVDASIFDGFDYVALGHLHGPQKIGKETVRYSGTPLKYSFSEANQKKAAVIVDVEEKGKINIQQIPLVPKHDMREIRGTYMEVTALDFYKDMKTDDYLYITLTDEEDIPDAIGKLRTIYPNIMKLSYDNLRTRAAVTVRGTAEVEEKSPMELLKEFYELQNNQPMTDEQEEIARGMMEEIWEDER